MRGWLVVVGLCACSVFAAKPRFDEGVSRLVSNDPVRVAKVMHDQLELGGVWFPDPACRRFSLLGPVDYTDQPLLARCLASLHLVRGKRRTSLLNGFTVIYPPGIELEAVFVTEWRMRDEPPEADYLGWLGFSGRESAADALPSITQELLESHRRRGAGELDHVLLDRELAARRLTELFAWLKVCIDASGTVTSVRPRLTNSLTAQQAFLAAASAWRFEPIVLGGQPAPVCAMMLFGYPRAPDLPLPFVVAAGATDLPLVSLEALGPPRAGELTLHPDWMSEFTSTGALACIDETGAVDRVVIARRSGFADDDERARHTLRGWAFAPYVVDGRPVRVCVATMMRRCLIDGDAHACPARLR
jgi:hypothetical protein